MSENCNVAEAHSEHRRISKMELLDGATSC